MKQQQRHAAIAPPLFELLNGSGAAVDEVISEWLEHCYDDTSLFALLQLLVQAATNTVISQDKFENFTDSDSLIDALNEIDTDEYTDFPLQSTKKIFKKSRHIFVDFWSRWMQSVHVQLIFNGDQGPDRSGTEIIEWIKSLIFALSSSAFRPFRYTATLAALSLNSALINVANSVEKNYGRLASRSKQSESVKRGARQDELEKRMSELSGNKEKIDVQIMEFINGVFVHRYRDIDPQIRKECITYLGLWINCYPSMFLDSTFLRYLGWMLSDKSPIVRMAAVKSFSGLLANETADTKLRHFYERFRPRIMEMALSEIDENIRLDVINLVIIEMNRQRLLEDDDKIKLLSLLTCVTDKLSICEAIGTIALDILLENSENKHENHFFQKIPKWIDLVLTASSTINGDCFNSDSSFRSAVMCALDCLYRASGQYLKRQLSDVKTKTLKSVVDTFENWVSLLDFIAYTSAENLSSFDVAVIAIVLRQSLKRSLAISYGSDTIANFLFEKALLGSEISSSTNLVQVSVSWDTIRANRQRFLEKASVALGPLIIKLGHQNLNSNKMKICSDVCALIALELSSWAMIGFITLPVNLITENSSGESPFDDSASYWSNSQLVPVYKENLRLLIDEIFFKHKSMTVSSAVARLFFGKWIISDALVCSLIGNSDHSVIELVVREKAAEIFNRSADDLLEINKESIIQALVEKDGEQLDLKMVKVWRFCALLKYRPHDLDITDAYSTNDKGVFTALMEFGEKFFGACGLDKAIRAYASLAKAGLPDFLSNYESMETEMESQISDNLLSKLTRYESEESSNFAKEQLFENNVVEWAYLIFNGMFHDIVYRSTNQKSGERDERLMLDIESWIRLAIGMFQLSSIHLHAILAKASEDSKTASKLTSFTISKETKSNALNDIERAARSEELASNYMTMDPLLIALILRCTAPDESLICMFSDVITLYYAISDRSRDDEVTMKLILSAVGCMRKFITLLFDSVLCNFFPNSDPDSLFSQFNEKDIDPDSMNLSISKRLETAEASSLYFSDRTDGFNWMIMWKNTDYHKVLKSAIKEVLVVMVRVAWFLLSHHPSSESSRDIIVALLSWYGLRGPAFDEIVCCIVEQLKLWSFESPIETRPDELAEILAMSFKKAFIINSRLLILTGKSSEEELALVARNSFHNQLSLAKLISNSLKSEKNNKSAISNYLKKIHLIMINVLLENPVAAFEEQDFLPSPGVSDAIDGIIAMLFKCLQQLTLPSGRSLVGSPFTSEDAKKISEAVTATVEGKYEELFDRLTGASLGIWHQEYQKYLRALAPMSKQAQGKINNTGARVQSNDEFPASPIIKRVRRF